MEQSTTPSANTDAAVSPSSQVGGPASKKLRAVVWGLSGTVLSGIGFIALALFEQYNSNLRELEHDLKHFHEVSGEFVKKDSIQRCYERLKESVKEVQASNEARARLEKQLDASERDRRELARDLQQMRERLATVEGRQAATILIPSSLDKPNPLRLSSRLELAEPSYVSPPPEEKVWEFSPSVRR